LKILVYYPNIINVYTGSNVSFFLKELSKQAECKFVGLGYPDSMLQEKKDNTGREYVISQASWQEAVDTVNQLAPAGPKWNLSTQSINWRKKIMLYNIQRFYGSDGPDWVLGARITGAEVDKDFRLCRWCGDIHVTPEIQIEVANLELDMFLIRCLHSKYYFPTVKDFHSVFGLKPFSEWIKRGYLKEVSDDWYVSQLKRGYMFWPCSVEPSFFKPVDESQKKYDVSMIGSVGGFYPLRQNIEKNLPKLAEDHGWNALLRRPPSMNERVYRLQIDKVLNNPELRKKWLLGEDYAKALAESKILIFGSSVFRYPLQKYFEAMGCGVLVMADKPFHAEDLHFKPDYNFIEINADNWQEKLEYILEDDQLRETIARRGYETAMKYHTNEVRVKDFINELKKHDKNHNF